MGLILIIPILAIFVGAGFVWGYFVGRRRGQRDAQQGFPVLPASPQDVPRP